MKKVFIYITVITMLTTVACDDFLTIDPVGTINEKTLLTETGIEWMITGMYATLYTGGIQGSLAGFTYGDVVGGDANKGSWESDQPDWGLIESYNFSPNNTYISSPWVTYYNGVFRSNVVLDMLDKMKTTLEAKSGMDKNYYLEAEAQARFIRGIWYFELIKYYSAAVPWIGLEEYRESVYPNVSNYDGNNYIYIWDKVIADFQFAYDNLPEIWTPANAGRPNKWAAASYLAKVMMFQSSPYNGTNNQADRWEEVKTLLETIITEGVTSTGEQYGLHPSYSELFTAGKSDNTSENIFDIQQAVAGTQTVTNTTWGAGQFNAPPKLNRALGFLQPSQDLAQSYMVDEYGLPYLNSGYRDFPAVSQLLEYTTTVYTDLSVYMDPRIDFNLGRFGIPFYDWDIPTSYDDYILDISNGGLFFSKKHLPKKSDKGSLSVTSSATSTAKNFHLIRYAEILLWYAEALIETGNPSDAWDYVNQVRQRAANSFVGAATILGNKVIETTSGYSMENLFEGTTGENSAANYRIGPWPMEQFDTYEGATEALRAEYRAELAMEGRRWFDLCRWGIAVDVLNSYVEYESNFIPKFAYAVYNESYVCLPIPKNQIDNMSGLLVQTENWK